MKSELFMRKEKNAIDLFAAFLSVSSMKATEQNFDKLRKLIKKAEKRLIKEIKMKRMKGVSIGRHPYFQQRGSYDGEKMVVALRVVFNSEGMAYYDDMAKFVGSLGFKEKALALVARARGVIEELDLNRPTTHDHVTHAWKKEARNRVASKVSKIKKFIGNLPDNVKVHISKKPIKKLTGSFSQGVRHKPRGLWYDCDKEWITWMAGEMPEWGNDVNFIYLVKINKNKMFRLNNRKDMLEFTERFGVADERFDDEVRDIDWKEASRHADGIEICPFQGGVYGTWYYGWDVASGCVWKPAGLKLELVGIWDGDENEVVSTSGGKDITSRVASKFLGEYYARRK